MPHPSSHVLFACRSPPRSSQSRARWLRPCQRPMGRIWLLSRCGRSRNAPDLAEKSDLAINIILIPSNTSSLHTSSFHTFVGLSLPLPLPHRLPKRILAPLPPPLVCIAGRPGCRRPRTPSAPGLGGRPFQLPRHHAVPRAAAGGGGRQQCDSSVIGNLLKCGLKINI